MIIDAFPFFNELDMLECRLVELDDVVDRFVLVEANRTFDADPKPFVYDENRDRFAQWHDRLVHVKVDLDGAGPGMPVETGIRDAIARGIEDAADNDLLLLSDVDEIPNPRLIPHLRPDLYLALEQRFYSWAVDWQMPVMWYGSMAAPVWFAREGFQVMRDHRNIAPRVPDGGWHLSWIGGKDFCREKVATTAKGIAATEFVETRDGIESGAYLERGETISVFGPGARMTPVDVDDSWPRWIAERQCPDSWFRPR